MDKEELLVTIIINNYNYENFIGQAINSALGQSYKNIEIIIVDDGSNDNSIHIINSYGDKVKKIFKKNEGQASAFNVGFEASKGDLICFLDADDIFFPEKVFCIVNFFKKYQEAGWVFHELQYTDIDGKYIGTIEERATDKVLFKDFRLPLKKIERLPYFPATTGLSFRRELMKKVLPMPNVFRISADAFLRLASLCESPGVLCPYDLATHRQHGKNLYVSHPKMLQLSAETDILVAYYLRKKFPDFFLFTNRMFSRNVGQLFALKGFYSVVRSEYFLRYYKELKGEKSLLAWMNFISCSFLNYNRTVIRKWKNR
jgi:glycosyltransferase involved in cell wall biosynthesis